MTHDEASFPAPPAPLALPATGSSPGTSLAETLTDSPALVTGGGSGIGRGIAEALARRGAPVAVAGRRREPLEATVAAIEAAGGKALAVAGDVSTGEAATALVAKAAEGLGGLRILVNNAGIARGGPLEEAQDADIDRMVDIDLKGPVFITRAALPHLRRYRQTGGASVINISSSVTFGALKNFSVYSAAKAGLDMLTRCWALELAEDRIRVNALSPGVVETPIFATMLPEEAIAGALVSFASSIPLGRVGQPEDIAAAAAFLAGPQAPWITGAVIPVDGGQSLSSDT